MWSIPSHPMSCFPKHVLSFPLDWDNLNSAHFQAKNSLNFFITLQTQPNPNFKSLINTRGAENWSAARFQGDYSKFCQTFTKKMEENGGIKGVFPKFCPELGIKVLNNPCMAKDKDGSSIKLLAFPWAGWVYSHFSLFPWFPYQSLKSCK